MNPEDFFEGVLWFFFVALFWPIILPVVLLLMLASRFKN